MRAPLSLVMLKTSFTRSCSSVAMTCAAPASSRALFFRRAARESDGNRPNFVGDLDGGQSDAARSSRDQDRVALRQLADVDYRPVGGEVLHPDGRRLFPREVAGMVRHGVDGRVREVG